MAHHRWQRSPHYLLVLLLAVVLLSLAACGSSGGTGAAPTAAAPTVSEQAIPWDEASAHIGESVTIEGPVAGVMYSEGSNGSPTFLNVGADYPDESRFTVVIWGADRGHFEPAPEDQFSGQTIRVTGTVVEYQGMPQIEVATPSDIETVE
jgi:DNA/RNA endonuclease YhcR with UshA esterase domain